MALRKTGHLADHPEVVKRRRGLHHAVAAGILIVPSVLPMSTNNRAKLDPSRGGPGILDQHDVGACEGHAHASAGTLRLANMGQSQGLISATMLYQGALLMDSTIQPDGTLSPVTDTGTMPSSIDSAWLTYGAILAKDDPQFPCSRQVLYQDPSNDNSTIILPPPERLEAASPYRYGGTYFIQAAVGSPARLYAALQSLAAGCPITDAIAASGPEFQNYTGGVISALSGPIDHANLIVDYTWTGSAADWQTFVMALQQNSASQVTALVQNLKFICVNSWGVQWGQGDQVSGATGGTYEADIVYFDNAQDLSVIDIQAAA